MIARASGLLAVAAVGIALSGCQTTQEKSAELQRQAQQERQREEAAAAQDAERTTTKREKGRETRDPR
jgi:hypothetical protein